jgi:hypothetical protein
MTSDPTPEQKAIAYCESLGLNTAYHEAVKARNEIDAQHKILLGHRAERRRLEQFKADVEMEVMEDERTKHTDMSQAQMDKHLRVAFSNNGDIRETRDSLATLAGEIDFVEFEIERLHQDIKIAVARLHELGGYFQFMAVVKQADEARKAREAKEKDPWTT